MQTSETVTAAGLLRASFAQIARNRRQILPIMALIWLLQLPSFFSEAVFLPLDVMELIGLPPGVASMVPAIIVMLAVYLGTAWSAVGWHRLTLLGEQPAAVLPRWQLSRQGQHGWLRLQSTLGGGVTPRSLAEELWDKAQAEATPPEGGAAPTAGRRTLSASPCS